MRQPLSMVVVTHVLWFQLSFHFPWPSLQCLRFLRGDSLERLACFYIYETDLFPHKYPPPIFFAQPKNHVEGV